MLAVCPTLLLVLGGTSEQEGHFNKIYKCELSQNTRNT